MNNDNRLQIIKENFRASGEETLKEYTLREAENDPKFFNWFFGSDASNIDDFGRGMTAEQQKEWEEFQALLPGEIQSLEDLKTLLNEPSLFVDFEDPDYESKEYPIRYTANGGVNNEKTVEFSGYVQTYDGKIKPQD